MTPVFLPRKGYEMKRFVIPTLATLLAGLVFAAAPAQAQSVTRLAVNPPSKDASAKRAWAKMDTMKISLDFEDAPFMDVFKFLRTTSGINMVLDGAVKAEGLLDEKRINIEVTDIPLRSALKIVLDFSELVARWKHGVLLITTPDRAQGTTFLRIYDVRDITFKLTNFPGPTMELNSGNGMDDGGGLSFGDDDEDEGVPSTEEIVETIGSSIGDHADAPNTSMTILGGILVVRQSAEVHRLILDVLAQLRSAR